MRLVHWLIVLSAGLGAIIGTFIGPWVLTLFPVEPVWLRPVAIIGLLLVGVLAIVGGIVLRRRYS